MNDDKDKLIARIKKCLSLSKSDNENEAATALRQAQKLMARHGITESEIELSDVCEFKVSAGSNSHKFPAHLSYLTNTCMAAFGVDAFLSRQFSGGDKMVFVGLANKAEIAAYCYAVLRRKVTRNRGDYYKSLRGKRINKIRKADLFALAWTRRVGATVRSFAQSESEKKLLLEYQSRSHPDMAAGATKKHKVGSQDWKHISAGHRAASDVHLYSGVAASQKPVSLASNS